MREEYDFSQGVRGKHCRAYRAGHTIRVTKSNGTVEERYFTLGDGAVMFDPELKARFPDSQSVNRALRSLSNRRLTRTGAVPASANLVLIEPGLF